MRLSDPALDELRRASAPALACSFKHRWIVRQTFSGNLTPSPASDCQIAVNLDNAQRVATALIARTFANPSPMSHSRFAVAR
jgi:hypothetical protein